MMTTQIGEHGRGGKTKAHVVSQMLPATLKPEPGPESARYQTARLNNSKQGSRRSVRTLQLFTSTSLIPTTREQLQTSGWGSDRVTSTVPLPDQLGMLLIADLALIGGEEEGAAPKPLITLRKLRSTFSLTLITMSTLDTWEHRLGWWITRGPPETKVTVTLPSTRTRTMVGIPLIRHVIFSKKTS